MLNIVDLLEKRRKYKFDINHHDAWIEEVCKDKVKKTLYIIVPVNFLIANPLLKRFNEKYSIDGVFEIGNPFIDYTKYFCSVLVIAHSKENSKKDFKIGIFNNKCTNHVVDSCYDRDLTRIGQDDFTDTFKSYINIVREWVESNKKPSDFDSNNYEFNSFPQIYVDKKHLYPKYYANNCVNVRNISLNHVEQLNNVATILIPKYDGEVNVFYKLLRISRFTYPLELNCIEEINPTNRINVSNITLKKGDIVLSKSLSDDLPVLFDLDEDNIRASVESLVIRCHSIPPEYLYLYFRSKTGKQLLNSIAVPGTAILPFAELGRYPILISEADQKSFINAFQNLKDKDMRNYMQMHLLWQVAAYHENLERIEERVEDYPLYQKMSDITDEVVIEDIINLSHITNIRIKHKTELKSLLEDDLKEINICFKHKAYKAMLILAGSILEAVLIDWLSEIKGENFFELEWFYQSNGEKKEVTLINIINEIKFLNQPTWDMAADDAHKIRRKRNLVHAKLCLKEDEDINEDLCKKVIDYLKHVLKTRGIDSSSITIE